MPVPKDPVARASMPVLALTTVHAISHDGGIFVSILHLLPYLQAVLTQHADADLQIRLPATLLMKI